MATRVHGISMINRLFRCISCGLHVVFCNCDLQINFTYHPLCFIAVIETGVGLRWEFEVYVTDTCSLSFSTSFLPVFLFPPRLVSSPLLPSRSSSPVHPLLHFSHHLVVVKSLTSPPSRVLMCASVFSSLALSRCRAHVSLLVALPRAFSCARRSSCP